MSDPVAPSWASVVIHGMPQHGSEQRSTPSGDSGTTPSAHAFTTEKQPGSQPLGSNMAQKFHSCRRTQIKSTPQNSSPPLPPHNVNPFVYEFQPHPFVVGPMPSDVSLMQGANFMQFYPHPQSQFQQAPIPPSNAIPLPPPPGFESQLMQLWTRPARRRSRHFVEIPRKVRADGSSPATAIQTDTDPEEYLHNVGRSESVRELQFLGPPMEPLPEELPQFPLSQDPTGKQQHILPGAPHGQHKEQQFAVVRTMVPIYYRVAVPVPMTMQQVHQHHHHQQQQQQHLHQLSQQQQQFSAQFANNEQQLLHQLEQQKLQQQHLQQPVPPPLHNTQQYLYEEEEQAQRQGFETATLNIEPSSPMVDQQESVMNSHSQQQMYLEQPVPPHPRTNTMPSQQQQEDYLEFPPNNRMVINRVSMDSRFARVSPRAGAPSGRVFSSARTENSNLPALFDGLPPQLRNEDGTSHEAVEWVPLANTRQVWDPLGTSNRRGWDPTHPLPPPPPGFEHVEHDIDRYESGGRPDYVATEGKRSLSTRARKLMGENVKVGPHTDYPTPAPISGPEMMLREQQHFIASCDTHLTCHLAQLSVTNGTTGDGYFVIPIGRPEVPKLGAAVVQQPHKSIFDPGVTYWDLLGRNKVNEDEIESKS
ncbi:mediator of RNA polymerase II transcription subunit 12-like [Scaptodrosophila lebanonensis]|uniref:Mediator of RNA polymerase II transcription subunit 12-like n=1 Tax=Drosophila lebanonensis TaxID=7225 RepID=A0A6J2TTA7_DROLE|nr:mediator of RNA polymerase II transcription subunit 12-like [Scaptodrosophila lebanonensis]